MTNLKKLVVELSKIRRKDNDVTPSVHDLKAVLSCLRRSAIDYMDNPNQTNTDYLVEDIGIAYDLLETGEIAPRENV